MPAILHCTLTQCKASTQGMHHRELMQLGGAIPGVKVCLPPLLSNCCDCWLAASQDVFSLLDRQNLLCLLLDSRRLDISRHPATLCHQLLLPIHP